MVNLMQFIGRQIVRLIEALEGVKPYKLREDFTEYLDSVESALDLLYDGLYRNSFASFQRIHDEHLRQTRTFNRVYSGQKAYETIVMVHFMNIYRFIVYSTGAGIGVIALNQVRQ
jgi:hypothetical protein